MTSELERQLQELEFIHIVASEDSLTYKVKSKLEERAKGAVTQLELEDFLLEKLNLTCLNLDRLETEEYPDSAAEIHAALHTAFVYYEQGLLILEDFLAREAGASEFSLHEVFEVLHLGDECLQLFQGELEERLAPLTGINTLW
jgi:hypothetical protein